MALDWLPTYPDRVPHRRPRQIAWTVGVFTSSTIPVPDILATQGFLPRYPDAVPQRSSLAARMQQEPPPFTAALFPVSWLPTYADQVPHRGLSAALRSMGFEPPPGELVNTARELRWAPTFPAQVAHHRPPQQTGAQLVLVPTLIGTAVALGCLDLLGGDLTRTDLLNESLTRTDLLDESLASTTLIDGEFC